jgi:hypothetical protein
MAEMNPGGDPTESSAREPSAISRAVQKQRRALSLMLLLLLPLLALPIVLIAYIDRRTGVGFDITWIVVLALIFPAVLIVVPLAMRRKFRRIEALVPAHDGLVCPRCVQALDQRGADALHCGRCGRRFVPDVLRKYWDMSITDPLASVQLWREMMKQQPGSQGKRSLVQRILTRHDNMYWMAGSFVATWLVAGVIFALFTGSSLMAGALSFVHMIPFMLGLLLLMSNWKRREGAVSFCAACGYQRAPGLQRVELTQCPECGENWNQIGGVKHGVVKRRAGRTAAGVALAAIGLALIASPVYLGSWQAKILPTGSLIHEISRPNSGFVMNEWAELNRRALSGVQIVTLAEGLLAKRLSKSYCDRDDDNWLVAQIAADALPRELVERYYTEALDVCIIGPTQAKVGETITLAIGTHYRAGGGRNPAPVALISGFFVNDDPEPKGRQAAGIDGIMLGQRRLHYGGEDAGPGNGPALSIVPDEPGTISVRLELWIAHAPMGTVNQITWQEDGTPMKPAGTVRMEHRTIEHVIDVSE